MFLRSVMATLRPTRIGGFVRYQPKRQWQGA